MKLKDIKTNEGQQKLFTALVYWLVEQNNFISLAELVSSLDTKEFIKEYIEDDIDIITKEDYANKLQQFFIDKVDKELIAKDGNLICLFKKAVYEKNINELAFSKALPELNTTDKNQPDNINKLMCQNFTNISSTDYFLFPCAGRGSDALYVCETYNIPKDNCYFIEINYRLCLRLISLGFKNVIYGDILQEKTWKELYNILRRNNVIINKTLMNPPYDVNLHLVILKSVLTHVKALNPDCEIVSIQPARWIEDPLAEFKQGSDYKTYKVSIIDNLSDLQLIDATTACKLFNIMNATDLGIYTFKSNKKQTIVINNQAQLFNKLINRIRCMSTLDDHAEASAVNGCRCEVKRLTSGTGGHNLGDFDSSKLADVNIVWGPYNNGYTLDGKFFTDVRQKNQFTKPYFAYSIMFDDLETANNFFLSCNTKFYRRLIHLFKWDVNVPVRFLPYMEDYSHIWTDEEYCKFFNLTKEEADFMCKDIDDYRVKDFINYITVEE